MQNDTPTTTATIWKFPAFGPVEMPANATILDATMTPQGPALWALVDPKAPTERRYFVTVPTGPALPGWIADCTFLRTLLHGRMEATGPKILADHLWEIPDHIAKQQGMDKMPATPSKPDGGKPAKPGDPADWWKQGN
jgi:hypothetical protein